MITSSPQPGKLPFPARGSRVRRHFACSPLWRRLFAFAVRLTSSVWGTWIRATGPPTWRAARGFGYKLLWVLLMSNAMADLCCRPERAAGHRCSGPRPGASLPRQLIRGPISYLLWILCEIAIAACDLAEVIGAGDRTESCCSISRCWSGVVIYRRRHLVRLFWFTAVRHSDHRSLCPGPGARSSGSVSGIEILLGKARCGGDPERTSFPGWTVRVFMPRLRSWVRR